MKNVVFYLSFYLLLSCTQQKNETIKDEKSENIEKIDLVINKLENDSISFEQFRFLANCKCNDELYNVNQEYRSDITLPKTNLFSTSFDQLYNLLIPIARILDKTKMENEFSSFVNQNKDTIILNLKARDENIPLYPIVICDRLLARKRSEFKNIYINFINNKSNFEDLPHYYDQYINNEGLINNKDW